MAFLAAYASAAKLESDEGGDIGADAIAEAGAAVAGSGDAISDALAGAAAELGDVEAAAGGEGIDGGDDAAIEGGISNEALASSIDGALAQANENGE